MKTIPSDALKQIKANQARRRGLLPLEFCKVCGQVCDPATQTFVTLYRPGERGLTMHKACREGANV